ncbi:ABC transporter substrate-binding protein [Roseibium litorale]|uniref:ABC transporter substrate-binding protein n=1 Tax=Roseibium litorale TaxID=2803841 RepID=A0ABR9CST3_9HYPH|nr:ABC transporter substrate-binding protein [Roseibium litorale]MBD8893664.1 ABC transporter substrate-binding protein [Roseibium litorale]
MIFNGSIDRRRFLAGVGVASAALILNPQVGRANEPKSGGHFRVGIGDFKTTDTLDTTSNDTKFYNIAQYIVRNCLIEVAPGGKLIPELATSWESSPDAQTWVFKLRDGVTFHNGKAFSAEDVVYTIKRHLAEKSTSALKPFLKDVDSITVTGPLEVTIVLKQGNVNFPALLTIPAAAIVADGTVDPMDGNGTGPYKLEHWQSGVSAKFTKNQSYWKEGRGHFDSVELIAIADPSARTSALIGGQIDAYNQVNLKTVELLKRNDSIEILSLPSKAHYVFPMMQTMAPFNNPDAAKAMQYAINREDMVKRILNGYGTVGNDQPISSAYGYFNPDLPQREYDPDKAKSLLKKAGLANFAIDLEVSEVPFSGAVDAAVLYKQHAAEAGIDINVKRVPDDGYWDRVWTKVPLCASRWSGRPTEDLTIGGAYTTSAAEAGWNETGMKDEQLDQLVVAARKEVDEDKRRQMYFDMQEIIYSRGTSNIFAFANFVDATSKKIGHGDLGNNWDLDGFRAAERWWFV